jgi:hypothetical protein
VFIPAILDVTALVPLHFDLGSCTASVVNNCGLACALIRHRDSSKCHRTHVALCVQQAEARASEAHQVCAKQTIPVLTCVPGCCGQAALGCKESHGEAKAKSTHNQEKVMDLINKNGVSKQARQRKFNKRSCYCRPLSVHRL